MTPDGRGAVGSATAVANFNGNFNMGGTGGNAVAPDDLATIYNIAAPSTSRASKPTGSEDRDRRPIRHQRGRPSAIPAACSISAQRSATGDSWAPTHGRHRRSDRSGPRSRMVGAVARGRNHIYVYARNVFSAIQDAVDQNRAPVMSISFGGCELLNSTSLRAIAQQANAQGITWLVSSGDRARAFATTSHRGWPPRGPRWRFRKRPESTSVAAPVSTKATVSTGRRRMGPPAASALFLHSRKPPGMKPRSRVVWSAPPAVRAASTPSRSGRLGRACPMTTCVTCGHLVSRGAVPRWHLDGVGRNSVPGRRHFGRHAHAGRRGLTAESLSGFERVAGRSRGSATSIHAYTGLAQGAHRPRFS